MDSRVCVAAGDLWVRQIGGGLSYKSEHDLAMMVSDFLENGSSGAESWFSSDSNSNVSDFAQPAEKIQDSWHRHAIGKVPGGDQEYIDVVNYCSGNSERLIIDIDFQSHFEIARAVDSYDRILTYLPVVYVGPFTRLK